MGDRQTCFDLGTGTLGADVKTKKQPLFGHGPKTKSA